MAFEGYGAGATGGAGGTTMTVTTLADSGPGSLREAIDATGARIVKFSVHGTIDLLTSLSIDNPNITIDGSDTPGGGIALRNDPSNTAPTMVTHADNIILQYLRIRSGASTATTSSLDGLLIYSNSTNVMVDHCSLGWATDVNLLIADCANVTVQHCFVAQCLHNSTHTKGKHSRGFEIWGGDGPVTNFTMHHNLIAHNHRRNPSLQSPGPLDVRNNVMYNYNILCSETYDVYGLPQINFVGNVVLRGANNTEPVASTYLVNIIPVQRDVPVLNGYEFYVRDNLTPTRVDGDPEENAVNPFERQWMVTSPHATPSVSTQSANSILEPILSGSGATLPLRDNIDTNLAQAVRDTTGRIIDDPNEVGGWDWYTWRLASSLGTRGD